MTWALYKLIKAPKNLAKFMVFLQKKKDLVWESIYNQEVPDVFFFGVTLSPWPSVLQAFFLVSSQPHLHCLLDGFSYIRKRNTLKKIFKKRLLRHVQYSKSLIFVQKFNLDKTPTFSRVFHPIFFFDNFSREIKVVNS